MMRHNHVIIVASYDSVKGRPTTKISYQLVLWLPSEPEIPTKEVINPPSNIQFDGLCIFIYLRRGFSPAGLYGLLIN